MKPRHRPCSIARFSPPPTRQRGMVLAVVLVMLLVLMTLSISSLQTATMQEQQTYSLRDRALAMQSAEAALREAINEVTKSGGPSKFFKCENVSTVANPECKAVPDGTFSADSNSPAWQSATNKVNTNLVGSTPQYLIQRLGTTKTTTGTTTSENYVYRILARSHNPATDTAKGRSIVVLSSIAR